MMTLNTQYSIPFLAYIHAEEIKVNVMLFLPSIHFTAQKPIYVEQL
jgi:hypothetical protein